MERKDSLQKHVKNPTDPKPLNGNVMLYVLIKYIFTIEKYQLVIGFPTTYKCGLDQVDEQSISCDICALQTTKAFL